MPLRSSFVQTNTPFNAASSLSTAQSQPYSRTQSAMRPSTPRFDGSTRPSFQRSPSSKQQRRQFGHNLTLPGLPRFHPANFASSGHSSVANTPGTNPNSPHGPASPGMHQKMYAEAQRQVQAYQRDLFPRSPSSTTFPAERPDSPRLQPLGSPGPVTPLELETGDGGYLYVKSPSRLSMTSNAQLEQHSEQLAEKLAQAQSTRLPASNKSPRSSSTTQSRSR